MKISDEEIAWLRGISPEEGAKKLLTEYGVSLVYATLDPKGCYVANASHHTTVGSPSGIQVIDTTGAGGIFVGSAMGQFLQYKKPIRSLGRRTDTNRPLRLYRRQFVPPETRRYQQRTGILGSRTKAGIIGSIIKGQHTSITSWVFVD